MPVLLILVLLIVFGPKLLVSGSKTLLSWEACGMLWLTAVSGSSVIPLILLLPRNNVSLI